MSPDAFAARAAAADQDRADVAIEAATAAGIDVRAVLVAPGGHYLIAPATDRSERCAALIRPSKGVVSSSFDDLLRFSGG